MHFLLNKSEQRQSFLPSAS